MKNVHIASLTMAGLFGVTGLVGCSSSPAVEPVAKESNQPQAWFQQWSGQNQWGDDKLQFDVNFYTRGLMQDLVSNLQYVNETTPVAVASFVLLDSEYNETNVLGNQIAEGLIHEIHKFGIPVIDFKTTEKISVTAEGDYLFSRNSKALNGDLPIRYVFAGTLVKHQEGYLVNARVVGMTSKAVVASAQTYIPEDAARAILDNARDRAKRAVKLVEG